MKAFKVLMIGPDRTVHGGVSAMVNNLYDAGMAQRVELKYIGTMVDGCRMRKLIRAVYAYLYFLCIMHGYDIVHVNMASDGSYYRKKVFIDTAAFFHKKLVIHEHGGNFKSFYNNMDIKQQSSVRKTLNKAAVFIVLSDEWREFFSRIVTKAQIRILHNAVLVPAEGRSNYSDHNLLYLGRICKDKGIGELLAAMDRLHEVIPDIHLYIGGIYEEQYWKAEVDKRSEYVTCTGWIVGEEKIRLLKDICSVFVLPSYYEGQPVSLMEAMSYGLAPVASKIGGIEEIMGHEAGITVPAGSAEELESVLKELVVDTDRKKSLGTAARKRIISEYDISLMTYKLLSIYEEIE